ncbi:MAG: amidohydrolase family protein [Acidobacteriota bacterium]|nr:amidohydrolase family protein [Acidobacteriota bacterium]
MSTIDAWIQHPTSAMLESPIFATLRRWTGGIAQDIPLEITVKAMQDAGIGKALMSAWYGPDGVMISNEQVARNVSAYPDLFHGVVGVDLRNPVKAVRELRKWVKEHDFVALRVIQWLWDKPCTHPLYYPLFSECVELDVPVCLQVGLTGPLCGSETGRPLHIERVALDFPDLKIVCGHVGHPWTAEMIAFATKFENVYIDTSAYKPTRYPPELVYYMKHHGKRKVLFGSNYPMITPADCLNCLDVLGLDDEIKKLFLSENAARVFKLN